MYWILLHIALRVISSRAYSESSSAAGGLDVRRNIAQHGTTTVHFAVEHAHLACKEADKSKEAPWAKSAISYLDFKSDARSSSLDSPKSQEYITSVAPRNGKSPRPEETRRRLRGNARGPLKHSNSNRTLHSEEVKVPALSRHKYGFERK